MIDGNTGEKSLKKSLSFNLNIITMTFKSLKILVVIFVFSCSSEVRNEMKPLVERTNKEVRHIDANHRVEIIEDDFHEGDSLYKIRAYQQEGFLLKLVGVINTPHFEREDYFYFVNNAPIFSGHLVNEKDDLLAAEYKYYYEGDEIVEALYWEDHYQPGKQFPHEKFQEFTPSIDSLMKTEKDRIDFLLTKIRMEGFEIKHLNENLQAN